MPARVIKRDGREVPFDERKIAAAIGKALAAVGEDDPQLGTELARVVALTLEGRHDAADRSSTAERGSRASLPDIEEIQDLVEQALIEMGRASVAKAYILYRDRRARAREALLVHPSPDPALARARDAGGRVELGRLQVGRIQVEQGERSSPWSKARIVAALINEAEVTRDVAERVAARVEERVFDAGLRRISTNLIRELVDNELVSLGLANVLRRQISFGVPVFDLRAQFNTAPEPLDPSRAVAGEHLLERRVDARVASEVLRRYALHEVFSEASARAHLAGDVQIVELARAHQVLTCAVPAHLLSSGANNALAAFERLGELAAFAADTAYGVVLDEPSALLTPLVRDAKGGATLGAWLRALAATARACERRIDISLPPSGARGASMAQRLIEELAGLEPSAYAPRLFIDESELELLAADRSSAARASVIDELLVAERLIVTWGGERERCVAPGLHRFEGERALIACGGAIALNLPRAALRAGPWREDRMFENVASLCSTAVDALTELAAFQQRSRTSRPGDARGRTAYCVTPVGLREALALLGDGEIRAEQGSRLLGFVAEALQRASSLRHLSIVVAPFFGERARVRFAALDAELPQHAQRLLYDDGVGANLELGRPYSSGYRLSPVPGSAPWEAEAELLSTLPTNTLHPLPELRGRGEFLPLLEAWRRFAKLRRHPQSLRPPAPHRAREAASLFSSSLDARVDAHPSAALPPAATSSAATSPAATPPAGSARASATRANATTRGIVR